MNKLIMSAASLLIAAFASAQVEITELGNIKPDDEMFMDMAVMAAKKVESDGLKPGGAVIAINGTWRATGTPSEIQTPEENAIERSRRTDLSGATLYTINQPTSLALNAIMRANVSAVYFVNPSAEVVAAGIYSPEDYSESVIDTTLSPVKIYHVVYQPAQTLLK